LFLVEVRTLSAEFNGINRKLIVSASVLALLLIIGLLLVANTLERTEKEEETIRTEIKPILDRFPLLYSVHKAYWKASVTGKTNFGPSSYWIKGYVYIGDEQLKEIKSYEWAEATGFSPAFTVDHVAEPSRWLYSEKFNQYIKSKEFIGHFYYDENNERLYFDVES